MKEIIRDKKCEICGKMYSKAGMPSHLWRSHGDGRNHKCGFAKGYLKLIGKTSWNLGLTSENDNRVLQIKNTLIEGYKSGRLVTWQKDTPVTEKTKQKISNTVSEHVKNDNWHTSGGRTKHIKFTSKLAGKVDLMGSWELAYAKYLDDNNIKWRRPTEKFLYKFEKLRQGKGYYTPDFFLIDENTYVEIKGYETEKDRAKWSQFPMKLKIIKKKEMQELNFNIPS